MALCSFTSEAQEIQEVDRKSLLTLRNKRFHSCNISLSKKARHTHIYLRQDTLRFCSPAFIQETQNCIYISFLLLLLQVAQWANTSYLLRGSGLPQHPCGPEGAGPHAIHMRSLMKQRCAMLSVLCYMYVLKSISGSLFIWTISCLSRVASIALLYPVFIWPKFVLEWKWA